MKNRSAKPVKKQPWELATENPFLSISSNGMMEIDVDQYCQSAAFQKQIRLLKNIHNAK